MRCKVPAASGPRSLQATHAPPRRPEVTPAAHTDRMLRTPPDIATRSQSAGRGVNCPDALLLRSPLAGTGPAGAPPPSPGASLGAGSFHPPGVSLSTRAPVLCLLRGPPNPRAGLPGSALSFLPTRHSAFWEAHFSSTKLVLEILSPGVSRCPSVSPPAAAHPSTKQGAALYSRELPGRPWTATPWQRPVSELPLVIEGSLAGAGQASTLLWS